MEYIRRLFQEEEREILLPTNELLKWMSVLIRILFQLREGEEEKS